MIDRNSEKCNIWAVMTGTSGNKWDLFKEKEIIAAILNDEEKHPDDFNLFVNEIKKGDIVLALRAGSTIQGVGRVMSDYIHPEDKGNPGEAGYNHVYSVKWIIRKDNHINKEDGKSPLFGPYTDNGAVRKINCDDYEKIKDQYLEVGIDFNSFKELKIEPVFSMIF